MAIFDSAQKAIEHIQDVFGEIASKEEMDELGRVAIDLIKKRTRLGYGVREHGGDRGPLKPLSQRYIDWRKQNRRSIPPSGKPLSGNTRPGKSNLTLTGQMLDSIKIVSSSRMRLDISPVGRRLNERLTNERLAEIVSDAGREFMNLSRPEIEQIARVFEQGLSDPLRRRLGKN